jgi:hypothetical protein
VQAAGVGDTLEHFRGIAKPLQSHPASMLDSRSAWGMRSNDLDFVSSSRDSLGDPSDKGAGWVAGEARIIVGDDEDA